MERQFNTLEEFILYKRARGGYTFTLHEVREELQLSDNSARQTLHRYQEKGQVTIIRNGFYVILPPEYSERGILPYYLFIDDLMKWLGRKYYVALSSAAALHGAAHQQPMSAQVMIGRPPLRSIRNDKIGLSFIVKNTWQDEDIIQKKTDAGFIFVSKPELTALDLLSYSGRTGIDRAASIISEMTESMNSGNLEQTASGYPKKASIQRLGYILDQVTGNKPLADTLQKVLQTKKCFYVPLSPFHPKKGEFITRWKIIKNIEIEPEI